MAKEIFPDGQICKNGVLKYKEKGQEVYKLEGNQVRVEKSGVVPLIILSEVQDLETIPVLIKILEAIQEDHL